MLCCLCLQLVSASSRKRKNFHGSSCDSVRQTLTRLSRCPLNALVQTSNPNAVICVVCHKKLVSIKACEEKLAALEGDVKNMLSSLTTIQSKRPQLFLPADTELQPPPPKQFRQAMPSLPFSQPPRVTLLTSHSSHQELSGAEHVSVTSTHTQEVSSTLSKSSSNITSLICDSSQRQSPPCSRDPSTSQGDISSSISLAQHPSTPQHRTSTPSQGLSPSVRVSTMLKLGCSLKCSISN